MKTYTVKAADIKREWHVIDAADETLGKLATRVAHLLMGKHKPLWAPNADGGDFVVILNAKKIKFTGNKGEQKIYYSHSGYPGGLKSISLDKQMALKPEVVIEHAVKGMLPDNKLQAKMMKRLRVFAGETHPYSIKGAPAKKTETGS